jgi:hypothetical protein
MRSLKIAKRRNTSAILSTYDAELEKIRKPKRVLADLKKEHDFINKAEAYYSNQNR